MAIDNPLDAIKAEPSDAPREVAITATVAVVSLAFPVAGVIATALAGVRTFFSAEDIAGRHNELARIMNDEFSRLENRFDLESRLISKEARQALQTALKQALLSDGEKLTAFGRLLGRTAAQPEADWKAADSFIQDIGRLTDDDLNVLKSARLRDGLSTNPDDMSDLSPADMKKLYWHLRRLMGFAFVRRREPMVGAAYGTPEPVDPALPKPEDYELTPEGRALAILII